MASRARHARRPRWPRPGRVATIVATLLAGVVALRAGASEPSLVAALGSNAPEAIVVRVVLNNTSKGEYFLAVVDGRLLVRRDDLRAIGLAATGGRPWQSGDTEYIWVDSIPGVRATFDESRLSLDLVADPKLLPASTVDLWAGRSAKVTYPDNASAFLNYAVGYAGGNAGFADGVFGTTQLGLRTGDFLFLGDSTCASNTTHATCVRLNSSLIHDNRDTLVRTIAGDFGYASNSLGATLSMGGLSYSKVYDIDPYFIRYPQQSLVGTLPTASEVDVYIDGQRVRTLRLPAGEFDLRNVTQATGYRNVDLVIRDSFGREQRVNTSFYSSERSLKRGLHEYSYNVGALRENFGTASNDYGPLVFAAFHRYGVSDAVTLGVRAEGKSGLVSGGPSATFVLGSAGILNLAASASEYDGRTGGAALATYSYVGQHWNVAALVRKDSPNYANLSDVVLMRRPIGYDPAADPSFVRRNWEAAGTVGYASPVFGSLSVGMYAQDAYQGQDRRAATISYGRSLFDGRSSFFVTVVNERAYVNRTDVFAGFQYNFDVAHYLTGYYQRVRGATSESLIFQQAQPVGEGLGYSIGVSRQSGEGGSTTQLIPSFQYNGRWAELRGYAQQGDGDGSPRSYSASVAGGLAWTGGMLAAGRPVTDSFGVVKVDELEGVRVRVNNYEIGRTGPDGRLFVPSLSSFNDNQISIDIASVPMEFALPESMRVVSPAYRSGVVVNFHARKLQAFVGVLRIRVNGTVRPAEFFDVTLDVPDKPVTFVTGRGGEFYVEDLPPGRHSGRMSSNGTRCRFELDVRPAQGALTDLGEVTCQQDDPPTETGRMQRIELLQGGLHQGDALTTPSPAPPSR
ncbi:MAG: fimbrial biogenesis outer membrane usher protein [Burkholderiales bacterium]|nr:fimbrial biogenesis outer membrane usher protein [Burkholderiales bacterium]